ncbi:MAG: 50S ribosomal protein L15 [Syntrophobacteraceae bacterium]
MRLHDLAPNPGARTTRKRVGRGTGSGLGKTAAKGAKGQKARSGGGTPPWFEGGQMPLQRRIPKRGFTNIFKVTYSVVNLDDLGRFEAGSEVGPDQFAAAGFLKRRHQGIKLLAGGDLPHALTIRVHKASEAAVSKVQEAGGRVEIIQPSKGK